MQTYLVGGAVRDQLLGQPCNDLDYVVVGSTPEAMREKGFIEVGRTFPVYLHPETGEEYALARTEEKILTENSKTHYRQLDFKETRYNFSPETSLEQDLGRRDLTINAMARHKETGELVDPYGGQRDLSDRTLRHVSAAFADDPLRVLRVARFAARYAPQGFAVADETMTLMKQLVNAGELTQLCSERIWAEIAKAMKTDSPDVFIRVLRECGALERVLPEVDKLFGVPQPKAHHPEVCAGEHTLLVLKRSAELSRDPLVRFAALCHDLGKGATDPSDWPHHYGHELRGADMVKEMVVRLRMPKRYAELAYLAAKHHIQVHQSMTSGHRAHMKLLDGVDAWRKPGRFAQLLLVCEADAQGRLGHEHSPYPQARFLAYLFDKAQNIDRTDLFCSGLSGSQLGELIQRRRGEALRHAKKTYADSFAAFDSQRAVLTRRLSTKGPNTSNTPKSTH